MAAAAAAEAQQLTSIWAATSLLVAAPPTSCCTRAGTPGTPGTELSIAEVVEACENVSTPGVYLLCSGIRRINAMIQAASGSASAVSNLFNTAEGCTEQRNGSSIPLLAHLIGIAPPVAATGYPPSPFPASPPRLLGPPSLRIHAVALLAVYECELRPQPTPLGKSRATVGKCNRNPPERGRGREFNNCNDSPEHRTTA